MKSPLSTDEKPTPSQTAELKKLSGTFTVTLFERDGKKEPPDELKKMKVVQNGAEWSFHQGNEITQGFLWPTGHLAPGPSGQANWGALTTLLKAGIAGAKAGNPPGNPLQVQLDIDAGSLPIIWDADFLYGPRDASGRDSYVLCEINVSSVAPFPDTAPAEIARLAMARLQSKR